MDMRRTRFPARILILPAQRSGVITATPKDEIPFLFQRVQNLDLIRSPCTGSELVIILYQTIDSTPGSCARGEHVNSFQLYTALLLNRPGS